MCSLYVHHPLPHPPPQKIPPPRHLIFQAFDFHEFECLDLNAHQPLRSRVQQHIMVESAINIITHNNIVEALHILSIAEPAGSKAFITELHTWIVSRIFQYYHMPC